MVNQGGPKLDAVQRWLLAVIVHPDGVEAGIESPGAQQEVPLTVKQIEQMIGRSLTQTSIERLEVYSNAYRARLLEVLIGEYPALVHAIGEEVFIDLANGYLEEHPPSSYTLADLGRSFADYLARSRPPRKNDDESPDWADFLIDLARLERHYSEIFDGPGIEGQTTLQTEDVRGLSPEKWLATRLIAAPCLRLATFRFAVHEYASAVRHNQEPELPAARAVQLAITRRDFIVRRVELGKLEARVLSALISGASIGEALETLLAAEMETFGVRPDDVNDWFRNWSAAGYFVGVNPPTGCR